MGSRPKTYEYLPYKRRNYSFLPGKAISRTVNHQSNFNEIPRILHDGAHYSIPSMTISRIPSSKGNTDPASAMHLFPSSFDPRKAANMPCQEKVEKWIQGVPFHYEGGRLIIDCFPAVHSDTDSVDEEEKINIDFSETDTILEYQSRKISCYTSRLYQQEAERVMFGGVEGYEEYFCNNEGSLSAFGDEVLSTSLHEYLRGEMYQHTS